MGFNFSCNRSQKPNVKRSQQTNKQAQSTPWLQLSEEAEKWAASYRPQIPMQTDPQMARRVIDAEEVSRYVQTESGDILRARSSSEEGREGVSAYQAHYSSVSDVEDDDDDEDHSDGELPHSSSLQLVTLFK